MLEAITADDTLFPQQSFLELQMLCVPLVVSAKDFCLKNSFNVRTLLERHSPSLIAYDSVAGVASKLSSSAVNIDKVIRMMSEMKETLALLANSPSGQAAGSDAHRRHMAKVIQALGKLRDQAKELDKHVPAESWQPVHTLLANFAEKYSVVDSGKLAYANKISSVKGEVSSMLMQLARLKSLAPEDREKCVADINATKKSIEEQDLNVRQLASYSDTAKHDMECWDTLMKVVFPFLPHAAAAFGLCSGLPTDFTPTWTW